MTREEAIEYIKCGEISNRWGKNGEEVERMAIEALQQQEEYISKMDEVRRAYDNIGKQANYCGDAISRQAAKQAIREHFSSLCERVEINTILNELPSVEPVRPRGHWKPRGIGRSCSVCGIGTSEANVKAGLMNYCPNCGASMESEKQS